MMQILEQLCESKTPGTEAEDMIAVGFEPDSAQLKYVAVIDGATPKTSFRFTGGETPGHMAARVIADALSRTETTDGIAIVDSLTKALNEAIPEDLRHEKGFSPPTASMVLFVAQTMQVIQVGDCSFAFVHKDGRREEHRNPKLIDQILADWRASIIGSLLSRGVITADEIAADDPGRRLIQPFITRQTVWQNANPSERLAFGAMDGSKVPDEFVKVYDVADSVEELILASDGVPELLPSLAETIGQLNEATQSDRLCIEALKGTKGVNPEARWADDVTYVRIRIQ